MNAHSLTHLVRLRLQELRCFSTWRKKEPTTALGIVNVKREQSKNDTGTFGR